ncbi:MAG: N-acetylmuramoyl-L-alanine amidase [Acidobacteriaceae bacterium]
MLSAARLLRAICFRSRPTPAWQTRAAWSLLLLSSISLQARKPPPPAAYVQAQFLHESLQATPEPQRTRISYQRVLDAYRSVYRFSPYVPKADASALAVAQLLTEEGRLFSDQNLLLDALGQYAFMRVQYPRSFHSQISAGEKQTRQDLATIRRIASRPLPAHSRHNAVLAAAIESQESSPAPAKPPASTAPRPPALSSRPPPATVSSAPLNLQEQSSAQEFPPSVPAALHPGQVSPVTGIRHWSTPVYTRIAIDLGDQVAYQAARVPGPDRIYFDLYGTRLAPGLNGRSVEVVDDGFLKQIRVAQFSNNVTRIVLDVSSVSDYSAFLLPNPWRLIIDIHGLKPGATRTTNLASLPSSSQPGIRPSTPSAPAKSVTTPPSPVQSPTQSPTQSSTQPSVKPAPQPAAMAAAAAGPHSATQEIAALGQQPNRVQATDRPTTGPIVASVPGTVPASQPDDGSLASPSPPSATTTRSRKKPSPIHPAPADDSDADSPPMHEAEPTAAGERSLVRTLGLKIGRIVIDAGHGGHDSGTTGPGGIEEKTVVLDVALRLGKLLRQRLGADVIFTRDNDTFIPLETRTAIANKAQADLFLSIHANSSPDSSARGVETYYLNFTTSPDALEVAARENAVSDQSIHELSDLVKKITLKDKIDESREFAADVQRSLYSDLEDGNPGLRDRGVKKAPFVVLIGANMPSILAEISFLTNNEDAHELEQPAYRQRIAESLYHGVARYISGLSGMHLAQNTNRSSGN